MSSNAQGRVSRALEALEYKPFEPAFYHTDIADWGMAPLPPFLSAHTAAMRLAPTAWTGPGRRRR